MRIMLYRWIKSLPNEVLKTRRIQNLLITSIIVEGVPEKFTEAIRIKVLIRHGISVIKLLVMLSQIIIPQLIYGQ